MGSTWANQTGLAAACEVQGMNSSNRGWRSPPQHEQRSTYEQQWITSSSTTMLIIIPGVLPSFPLEHEEEDCQLCYDGTPHSKYVYLYVVCVWCACSIFYILYNMCIVIYQILLLAIATKIKLSIELITPGFAIYYYNNYSNARSISTIAFHSSLSLISYIR